MYLVYSPFSYCNIYIAIYIAASCSPNVYYMFLYKRCDYKFKGAFISKKKIFFNYTQKYIMTPILHAIRKNNILINYFY